MATGKHRKVARQLKYRSPGMAPGTVDLSDLAGLFDRAWDDNTGNDDTGDDDGGVGVREPRRPLPPSPVGGAGARPLPEPIITANLPNPPQR